jgi:transitional endoplasmic reticulum ATPase
MIRLIPAQEAAYGVLKYASQAGSLLLLSSPAGRGRTTVLRRLHEESGGGFVTGRNFIETSAARHPLSLEETLYSAVTAALKDNEIVYLDDIDLIHDATSSCHFYPRGQYVETALLELSDAALRDGKKLIVSTDGSIAQTFATRSFSASIARYSAQDYAALLAIIAGAQQGARLDADKIYRFAPKSTRTRSAPPATGCTHPGRFRRTTSFNTSARSGLRAMSIWRKCRKWICAICAA